MQSIKKSQAVGMKLIIRFTDSKAGLDTKNRIWKCNIEKWTFRISNKTFYKSYA